MNESDFTLLSSLRPLYILLLLAFTYSLPPHLNHLFYLYKVNRPGSCCQPHYRPGYGSGTQQLLRVYTNMDSCHCLLHYRFHIFFRWARSSSTWEGIQIVVSPFSIIITMLIVITFLLCWASLSSLSDLFLANFLG